MPALRVYKRCAAQNPKNRKGPSKPQTINRLHRSSQCNKQLLSANCLFINGAIINNIFLKIMQNKVLSKCRKCYFRNPKFKHFLAENPRTLLHVITLWGLIFFSHRGQLLLLVKLLLLTLMLLPYLLFDCS